MPLSSLQDTVYHQDQQGEGDNEALVPADKPIRNVLQHHDVVSFSLRLPSAHWPKAVSTRWQDSVISQPEIGFQRMFRMGCLWRRDDPSPKGPEDILFFGLRCLFTNYPEINQWVSRRSLYIPILG